MQIISLSGYINFKRQLHNSEKPEFCDVIKQSKQKLGNTGNSILIVPSTSLPQEINTGVGNFLDKEGSKFIDFAKLYWGINYIQLLPEGEYKISGNTILPYSGSSLSLGTHLINPEILTTKEFGEILTKDDVKLIADNNKSVQVNYENVIYKNSLTEKILRKGYTRLLKADTEDKKNLLKKFEDYRNKNCDWLETKAIFAALSTKYKTSDINHWNDFDRNLYNENFVSAKDRLSAIKKIRNSEIGKEADFYEFKQFLAETHLNKAKEILNNKGIKLSGDVLIGFSIDEIWSNPKAFIKDTSVGWGIPALDFESAEGEKLLRKKFNLFANRYDGLRLDASWIYASEPLENNVTNTKSKKEYGPQILDIIEDEIKKVKGINYQHEDIMHEFIMNQESFNIYEGNRIKPFVDRRTKIYCTNSMHSNWATVDNFIKRGWKDGSYVLGTTNHDCILMKKQYANFSDRKQETAVLSKILKIPQAKMRSLNNFIKAKFAEPMRSKHNMVFFVDALNLNSQYKGNITKSIDYKLKIPQNYLQTYFESLQKGEGFNIMDALEKAFVSKGLDKTEPELYKKIVKYQKILQEKEIKDIKAFNKINLLIGIGLGAIIGLVCLTLENNNCKTKNFNP